MKLAAKQLGDHDEILDCVVEGAALGPGLLLTIPMPASASAKPLRLLVTWDAIRKTIPKALAEFGPKMAAAKGA